MLIGELSAKTGLSRDTIRFYEKQGLIKVSRGQRRDNNYKEYPEEVVDRLLTVKRLKGLGFTLNESGDLLAMIGLAGQGVFRAYRAGEPGAGPGWPDEPGAGGAGECGGVAASGDVCGSGCDERGTALADVTGGRLRGEQ